eukprot:GHRQ01009511.1.p1 GENE.GHRQ01009511.1~~GHRQ01009511.1.p1  ORF type:complete len:216 (+),score=61.29 GHRQ01009511.1:748-1395(+)
MLRLASRAAVHMKTCSSSSCFKALPALCRCATLAVGMHTAAALSTPRLGSRTFAAAAAPARLGDSLHSIDTPSLIVDLDVFERNCLKLKSAMEAYPVSIRPHAKAHKCPQLAQLQLQLLGPSAVGVCCQKVTEAEAMVAGGVRDVLLSNEVVAPYKITRLVALAAQGARVSVVVDTLQPLEQLAATAQEWGTSVDVLVEINAGQDRWVAAKRSFT